MSFDYLANLQNLASQNTPELTASFGTKTFSGASGGSLFGTNNIIESGTSTTALSRISSLLSEGNRLTSVGNLQLAERQRIDLGTAVTDASNAVNQLADIQRQQIAIREQQRAEDNTFLKELNERLSGQVEALGKTSIDLSKTGETSFFQDLQNKLGFTGLLVGGAVLAILVLKK